MRDFSWKVFAMTGDVDAYLLYRQWGEPAAETAALGAEEENDYDEEAQ